MPSNISSAPSKAPTFIAKPLPLRTCCPLSCARPVLWPTRRAKFTIVEQQTVLISWPDSAFSASLVAADSCGFCFPERPPRAAEVGSNHRLRAEWNEPIPATPRHVPACAGSIRGGRVCKRPWRSCASNERAHFSRNRLNADPGISGEEFALRMDDLVRPALLLRRYLVHYRQQYRDASCPIFRHQAQRPMENSPALSLPRPLSNQTESA